MDRTIELDLLRRLLDLHEHRTTTESDASRRQPTSVYTDPGRARAETERLLRGRPLVAGLSAELPGPGTYFTADVGTVPVLVVRPPDRRVTPG